MSTNVGRPSPSESARREEIFWDCRAQRRTRHFRFEHGTLPAIVDLWQCMLDIPHGKPKLTKAESYPLAAVELVSAVSKLCQYLVPLVVQGKDATYKCHACVDVFTRPKSRYGMWLLKIFPAKIDFRIYASDWLPSEDARL